MYQTALGYLTYDMIYRADLDSIMLHSIIIYI